MKESQLMSPVVEFFISRGFKAYAEIPLSNRWIDLLFVDTNNELTIAVELKLTNWKRAFSQAKVYPLVADYVYVAMPEKYIHRAINNKQYFESAGIGLLSINGATKKVLNSKKSNIISTGMKNTLLGCLGDEREVLLDDNNELTKSFYPDIFGFRTIKSY